MKKSKKILIAVLSVVLVAVIVVGGLILGGVIKVGADYKANIGVAVQDDFLINTYKSNKTVYAWSLKKLYGLNDEQIADMYADNAGAWKTYTLQVDITNKSDNTLIVLNAKTDNNGKGNVWLRTTPDLAEFSVAPGGTGEFSIEIIAKGYSDAASLQSAIEALAPKLVCAENTNPDPNIDFDTNAAEKFELDIKL